MKLIPNTNFILTDNFILNSKQLNYLVLINCYPVLHYKIIKPRIWSNLKGMSDNMIGLKRKPHSFSKMIS